MTTTNLPPASTDNKVSLSECLNEYVGELQRENMRLQRLVSELLLRNQQLRSNA